MNTTDAAKIAMRGAGYYSSNTVGAKAVIDKVGDLVVEAIGRMPAIADAQPFSIADFGAADGGTSIDLMRRMVEAIRAREPDRQITITYTDLPHNDFAALFRLTQGLLGQQALSRSPISPACSFSAAARASIGRSFLTAACRSVSPPPRCIGSARAPA